MSSIVFRILSLYIFYMTRHCGCSASGHPTPYHATTSPAGCTLVGLSTRPTPLIISKSLQFRTFWSQSKALFMIRCMLSAGSGSKTFGALKVTICVHFFELSVHKMSNFLRISAFQWTMPSGLFAKKSLSKIFSSC